MTIFEFSLKAINKIPFLKRTTQSLCRYAVTHKWARKWLNKRYNRFNQKEKILFHYLFARIFRNKNVQSMNAFWTVKFNKTDIQMPLRSETLWLDWDLAVSIMGHDLEIKYFYEKIISSNKPNYFFDIGANYGTHSLLFLSQGVKAITFEPNPECKPIFESLLATNKLNGQLENYAIGEINSTAELIFPKTDTWNGSLQANYLENMETTEDLIRIKVDVMALDNYIEQHHIKPNIIKIDTEGFELNVLKGARKTLREFKPIVVFESNKATERIALFKEFSGIDYNIYDLESFYSEPIPLNENDFNKSTNTNFVGVNQEINLHIVQDN